jgi:DoxX-like family
MTRYRVLHSWLPLLAVLEAAAAVGLLVGIGVHLIGSAAAIGLIAYFVGAIVTVVRAHVWSHIAYPVLFLLPPTASLVLLLAST